MKRRYLGLAILALLLVGGLMLAKFVIAPSTENDAASRLVVAGDIIISDFWIAEPFGDQRQTALYLAIRNAGARDEQLTGATTPAAGFAHLHNTTNEDNVSRMHAMETVNIPAGGEVHLAPGGIHIMLVGLNAELAAAGERVLVTLQFAETGEVTFEVPVLNRADAMNW